MVVCADTSFLFALFGSDVHTPRALAWSRASTTPITVSELTEYELGNALRFAEFRKLLAPGEAATFWAQYEGGSCGRQDFAGNLQSGPGHRRGQEAFRDPHLGRRASGV